MENPALIPLSNMARRLRVPCGWLRDEATAGRVPALNAGGRLLFHPPAVEQALVSRAVGDPAAAGERQLMSRATGQDGTGKVADNA